MTSPFHAGEQALQARVGMRERLAKFGPKAIRDFMPDPHREFFAALPFVVVGALDAGRRPWASVLVGAPGFLSSPDPRTLRIAARPVDGDPIAAGLAAGAPVGLLGIQPEMRRRNRMNGTIVRVDEGGWVVRVDQSFGNCPQYIQARAPALAAAPRAVAVRPEGATLSEGAAAVVRRADTFFVATASRDAGGGDPAQGVDVSHRGGKPGFVRVGGDARGTALTWPDFRGNSFFNTLGNLAVNPHAGLAFVDFASGGLLSLTGTAEIVWDGAELEAFAGAQRLVRFSVTAGAWVESAVSLRWTAPEQARELAATGTWGG